LATPKYLRIIKYPSMPLFSSINQNTPKTCN
jgi:hypothetical protein